MTAPSAPGVSPNPLMPPPQGGSLDDPAWSQFFYQLYQMLMADGATFPSMGIQGKERKGVFTNTDLYQDLVTLDCGIYSNYSSHNGNIIYGFAANVKRSAGNAFTVGAQINAWADKGATAGVFGQALTAVGMPGFLNSCVGHEAMVLQCHNANQAAKWGHNVVFANRFFQAPTPVLGSNRYNYFSVGLVATSLPRSATGERCGWTRFLAAYGEAFDSQIAPAWNNSTMYSPGMVVTSGGLCYQAIQDSVNQLPAAISAYWVQHTAAGTTALAIGLDFSSLPTATLGRMSAGIRFRDTMKFGWETTGAVTSWFDPTTGRLNIVDNVGTPWLAVDVTNGFLYRNGVFLI